MSTISITKAISNIKKYIIGNDKNDIYEDVDLNHDRVCIRCNNKLLHLTSTINDFINIYIYRCNNCNTISEYQYNKDNLLIKEVHIYNNINSDSSSYSELINDVGISTFSIDRLYIIDNFLCYPVLFYNNFFDKIDVLFVKIEDRLTYDQLHGFIIHNNIIGYIDIEKQDHIAYFFNPYLERLPHADWIYIKEKQNPSDIIKTITPLRYKYEIKNLDNGINLHILQIMMDIPMKCIGIGLKIEFYTRDIPLDTKIYKLIEDLKINELIHSNSILTLEDKYTLHSLTIIEHTLSSIIYNNISKELKENFADEIKKIFTEYDI